MKKINQDERAEVALRMVHESHLMAFDTETSGTDWKRNFPVGYIFADKDEAVWVPVRCGGGGNLPGIPVPTSPTDPIKIHPFEKDLAKAFKKRTFTTVGHNIKFDCHMAANAKIYLGRNLSCTQNLETLLNEYARTYSLEACAERHKVQAKKGEELYRHIAALYGCPVDKKAMSNFWQLAGNDPAVIGYAEGDGITTYQLYTDQMRQISDQDLDSITDLENNLIWTLYRMERRGIRIDTDYLDELEKKIEERVAEAVKKLPEGFNVRSPIDVKKYIEDSGHMNWPTTDHGNPSFNEAWLRTFDEGKNIITVRKMTNLINTFVKPLRDEHTFKGRVHANINQLKSDDYGTPARLSYSAPNLQQIPKRDKELARLFRRAFLPDKGMDFNEADWSQCEPRLYAHYSQEPKLIEGYNKVPFDDVHAIVSKMLRVERDPTAKRMNMGIFTGMYPKSFAEHMGWPLDKATEKWNEWHDMLPKIRIFQDTAKQALLQRGYVKTILGRRLRLEHPRFAYRAVSKIIQGGNADIMKYKILEIDRELEKQGDKEAHLLATVHDSLDWQSAQTKHGYEVSDWIKDRLVDVQEPPFNLRVPFAIDHNTGANWAEATFGEEK